MCDPRIASLLPSATEIVYALGLDEQLVAVTFECNEPPRARLEKRVIVGGLDTTAMAPADIDRYVRDRLGAGGDLYTLHRDALADLRPDLILSQDLCRVCAVPTGAVRRALGHLGCRADVLTLDPHTLPEVLEGIRTVAAATGVVERGDRLVEQLRFRLERIGSAVRGWPAPRTAVIEWVDPPFGSGHWIPDLVAAAGGLPVAGRSGRQSVPTSWEAVAAERPEVVVVAPCGFGLPAAVEQTQVVLAALADRLPDARFWALDGDSYVVRPGPRLVDGVEQLARVLHPEVLGEPDPAAAVEVGIRSAQTVRAELNPGERDCVGENCVGEDSVGENRG